MSRTKSKAGRGSLLHPSDLSPSLCLTPSTSERLSRSSWVTAFLFQIEEAARDLARLGRRIDDGYGVHLVERVGGRIESLDALVWPTAGELRKLGLPADEALRRADERRRELRGLLGKPRL
jgi:hypothetical protein